MKCNECEKYKREEIRRKKDMDEILLVVFGIILTVMGLFGIIGAILITTNNVMISTNYNLDLLVKLGTIVSSGTVTGIGFKML